MTVKIKLSDLEKLDKNDLTAIVKKTLEIKESRKHKKLDDYLKTAHTGQLEFHKAEKRIRYFLGGNRCLKEDTKISTLFGDIEIGSIYSETIYQSFDLLNQCCIYTLGSKPFPKSKEQLYRVVHEKGEFVSSGPHLVLNSDCEYQHVLDLVPNQDSLLFSKETYCEGRQESDYTSYRKEYSLDDQNCYGIVSDFQSYYLEYSRLYDLLHQIFLTLHENPQSKSFYVKRCLFDLQKKYRRIHLDLCTSHISILDACRLFETLFSDVSLDLTSQPFFGLFFSHSQEFLKFLTNLIHQHKESSIYLNQCRRDISCGSVNIKSKILSVEKLNKTDWVWDLFVPDTNNYFSGGVVHHNSGKTTAGTVETLWWSMGIHPFKKIKTPNKGLVVVQDFENHAKNILEPKFLQWIPPNTIEKAERNQNGAWRKIYFKNGSVIDVLSHDQDPKVFEGADWDFAHFDEPPPQKVFSSVWRGLTDRGGHCWVTATPIVGPWMFNEIKKAENTDDPLRWFKFIDTELNAVNIGEGDINLGKKRITEFLDAIPVEEREARSTGKFLHMQGLIFKGWSRSHHLIPAFKWPQRWQIIESIDNHPHKPWAVSWIGIAENGKKVLLRSGLYEGVIEEIADQILYERTQLVIEGGYKPRIVRSLIDNSASVPIWSKSNTDPTARRISVREELSNILVSPRVEVAPKNVRGKIDIFKSWLHIHDGPKGKESDFYAFDIPENERFIYEIENYVWDTKRGGVLGGIKDQPRKVDDDIMDTVLQVALTLPRDIVEEKEVIQTFSGFNTWKV